MSRLLLLLAATVVCLTGCVIPADVGCTADAECYDGRRCIDGACTGEVPLSSNSSSNSSNGASNVVSNNGAQNVVDNNLECPDGQLPAVINDDFGCFDICDDRTPCGDGFTCFGGVCTPAASRRCETYEECPGDQVCAEDDVDPNGLQCMEPWACELQGGEGSPRECFVEAFCEERGPLFVTCEFTDADLGICFCLDEMGQLTEFDARRGFCEQPDFTDTVNRECRWRLPVF